MFNSCTLNDYYWNAWESSCYRYFYYEPYVQCAMCIAYPVHNYKKVQLRNLVPLKTKWFVKLGSVAGLLIKAIGRWVLRMTWGLEACSTVFHSEPASALSLLISWSLWGNLGIARCQRKSVLSCWIHPAAQSTPSEQQWDLLVSEHSVGFQIKIGRPNH